MTSAVLTTPEQDHTALPHVLRAGAQLGVLQSVAVALYAAASRWLSGPLELVVLAAVLIVGAAASLVLPGLWTKARTIEGIAGAAGIGLTAAGVFLVIDVVLFQPLGIYSNRWLEIGGGSNWWYHPVWWMAGTYLSWMGAWALANQSSKGGGPAPAVVAVGTLLIAAAVMTVAVVAGVPGAAFGLSAFGVSILPAAALMVVVSSLGRTRS
jgi:hypothetical protein